MTAPHLALASAGVLLGAATQRSTGLGFNLVSTPVLVLALGPITGVSVGNALSGLLCVLVLTRTWRDLDWRRAALLTAAAITVVPAGALVVATLRRPVLLVLVGGMAMLAMLATVVSERAAIFRGIPGAVAAGALSGFMNVTAGYGGPMITVHAISERWETRRFVPTAQGYLLVVNIASLAAKGTPDVPLGVLGGAFALLAAGAVAGEWVAARLDGRIAQRLAVTVALAGGAVTVISGLVAW